MEEEEIKFCQISYAFMYQLFLEGMISSSWPHCSTGPEIGDGSKCCTMLPTIVYNIYKKNETVTLINANIH